MGLLQNFHYSHVHDLELCVEQFFSTIGYSLYKRWLCGLRFPSTLDSHLFNFVVRYRGTTLMQTSNPIEGIHLTT